MEIKFAKQLEGLRFYAVFFIMIAHWLQWQWKNSLLLNIPFTHGVILFFVLSGYLISRILFVNKEQQIVAKTPYYKLLKKFYLRRILRIFPLYYLTIIFLFALNHGKIQEIYPWLFTYTSNIYQSIYTTDLKDLTHFWSLAVEEQFYLIWPFVILFSRKKTIWYILATIVIALITKTIAYHEISNWRANSYFTLCCMHALGVGSLLAYLEIYHRNIQHSISKSSYLRISCLFYFVVFIIAKIFQLNWYIQILDEFSFALVAGLIINKASVDGFTGILKSALENKFSCYAGKISYGLYVFHLFIPGFFSWLIPETVQFNAQFAIAKYLLFVGYFLVTFVLAHISFTYFETPFNTLKKQIL